MFCGFVDVNLKSYSVIPFYKACFLFILHDKLAMSVLYLPSPHLYDRTEIAESTPGQHKCLTAARPSQSLDLRVKTRA